VTSQTGGGHRLDRSCAAEAVAASRRLCSHASPRRSFSSPLKPSRSTCEQNSIWPLHPRSSEPSTLLARPERTQPPRQTPCSVPPPPETTLQRVSSHRREALHPISRRPGPPAYCRPRTPWPAAGPAPWRSTPGPPLLELSLLNQSPWPREAPRVDLGRSPSPERCRREAPPPPPLTARRRCPFPPPRPRPRPPRGISRATLASPPLPHCRRPSPSLESPFSMFLCSKIATRDFVQQ